MTSTLRPRTAARALRREWLSGLVLLIGLAYLILEGLIRPGDDRDAVTLVELAVQVALIVSLAAAAAVISRRRAETSRMLAADERQLLALLTGSPDPIAVAQDGKIAFVNPAGAALIGVPSAELLVGGDVLGLVDPADRAVQAANLARILRIGQVDTVETRVVRADGTVIDAEITGVAVRYQGRPAVQLVVRDVSARRAQVRELEESERRLRDLLDSMSLIAVSVAPDGTVRFANRATHELLGTAPDALTGASVFDLLAFPDPAVARAGLLAAVGDGAIDPSVEIGVRLPNGRQRSIRWHLALSATGDPEGADVVAIGEDITEALETKDRLHTLLASAPIGICAVGGDGTVRLAEGGPFARHAAGSTAGTPVEPRTIDDLPVPFRASLHAALAGTLADTELEADGRTYEATFTSADGVDGGAEGAIGVYVEVTRRANLERQGIGLATAIHQATDAVVITDPAGTITYVNPAFERVSGYGHEEALGQRPSILKSGEQSDALYAALWRTITAGRAWSGELVNRRKDGSLFREVANITPVRDRDGTIVSFVAVKRDVTRERSLEDALEREVRERAAIITALERIPSSGDAAAIAGAVCEQVLQLPGFGLAAVFVYGDDEITPIAYMGPGDVPIVVGRALPPSRSLHIRSRAEHGAWSDGWQVREEDGPYGERMAQAGVQAIAYVPLRDGDGIFGVLCFGTFARADAVAMPDRLPALGALGAIASSHLSTAVRRTMAEDDAHRDVATIIATGAFRPVFQPIVDLRTGEPLGYEALTRFSNGVPPDVQFQRAVPLGLGVDLEVATLQASVAAARSLPAGAFLTLNVSPAAALQAGVLADILQGADRPVVIEITEHAEIDDYAALRAVVRSLPVPARLAVDDAGAGFASLRHVLELAPDIVKIDRTLVEGIDRDPARQALLAGLRHFASRRGIQLIAEGIELATELAALTSLAIPLGQGYLLGRPVPVSEVTGLTIVLPRPDPDASPRLGGRSSGRSAQTAPGPLPVPGGPTGAAVHPRVVDGPAASSTGAMTAALPPSSSNGPGAGSAGLAKRSPAARSGPASRPLDLLRRPTGEPAKPPPAA